LDYLRGWMINASDIHGGVARTQESGKRKGEKLEKEKSVLDGVPELLESGVHTGERIERARAEETCKRKGQKKPSSPTA